jgi:hypothetical protein
MRRIGVEADQHRVVDGMEEMARLGMEACFTSGAAETLKMKNAREKNGLPVSWLLTSTTAGGGMAGAAWDKD